MFVQPSRLTTAGRVRETGRVDTTLLVSSFRGDTKRWYRHFESIPETGIGLDSPRDFKLCLRI